MFPNHFHPYLYHPYGYEAYPTLPMYEEIDFPELYDERIFGGGFPPPFSQPGQGPVGGPPFAPPGQGTVGGQPTAPPPSGPPPSFVPTQTQQAQAFAVDPGGIRRCLFRYTYVWLRGFQQFWFYPTFVGRNSVSGYRWTGFRWVYFGISLRQIQSYTCV
ncbi:hypothetical protein [Bacillus sp. T3]|uniref:hypothetical protein n=1 Tax=Bacillus sp. T3 TaxID=467262 RepID=UPI0029824E7C|nr:hypothetical protein [Bacillus sp. T3]